MSAGTAQSGKESLLDLGMRRGAADAGIAARFLRALFRSLRSGGGGGGDGKGAEPRF